MSKPSRIASLANDTRPPRVVLYAVEGWGKTTFGAHAPDPVFLMARGEDGLRSLLSSGTVPSVDGAQVDSWPEFLETLTDLRQDPRQYRTLVLDALGGFERLCHEHVCQRDFKNDWGERGFSRYQKGFEVSVTEIIKMLSALAALNELGLRVMILGHAQIKTFKSPVSDDYDRYQADVHHKTWSQVSRWADAVLFGNFLTIVDKDGQRARGIGGTERIVYCERRDAWDAKNRFGMPESIAVPNSPSAVYDTLMSYVPGGIQE